MSVPVTDVMEAVFENPSDLPAFGYPIRDEYRRPPVVRRSRPCSTFDPNYVAIKLCKELAASLGAAGSNLPVTIKVSKNLVGENYNLARMADGVRDHAARVRRVHTGQESDFGHERCTVKPPSLGSPIFMTHCPHHLPPAASMRLRNPTQIR